MKIEKIEVPALVAVSDNVNKVPKKQWAKWGTLARGVFNAVYQQMIEAQFAFVHPKAAPISAEQWSTIAWNAAWTAAAAVEVASEA